MFFFDLFLPHSFLQHLLHVCCALDIANYLPSCLSLLFCFGFCGVAGSCRIGSLVVSNKILFLRSEAWCVSVSKSELLAGCPS